MERWPEAEVVLGSEVVKAEIEVLQEVLELGRSERKATGLRVRQPLSEMRVILAQEEVIRLSEESVAILAQELNVKKVLLQVSEGEERKMRVEFETELSEELRAEGAARELMREIASERKKLGLGTRDDFVYPVETIPVGWQKEIETRTNSKLELKK